MVVGWSLKALHSYKHHCHQSCLQKIKGSKKFPLLFYDDDYGDYDDDDDNDGLTTWIHL